MSNRTIRTYDGTIVDLGSGVLKVERTLTSAEIKALHTTPVVLLAGVPGVALMPTGGAFRHRSDVVYVGGDAIQIAHVGREGDYILYTPEGLLTGADQLHWQVEAQGTGYSDNGVASDIVGVPVIVTTDAPFTVGTGVLDIVVWYYAWELPS